MKTYTLEESQKGLAKIHTFPNEAGAGICFEYSDGNKRVIERSKVFLEVQAAVIVQQIGMELGNKIQNDYPDIFTHSPLQVLTIPQSHPENPFAHLGNDLQVFAKRLLENAEKKIAQRPNMLQYQIDLAEVYMNNGAYQNALTEFAKLKPLLKDMDYQSDRARKSIKLCEEKIKQMGKSFETPFYTNKSEQSFFPEKAPLTPPKHSTPSVTACAVSQKAFFFSPKTAAVTKDSLLKIENLKLQHENITIMLKDFEDGWLLSVMGEGKKEGMIINERVDAALLSKMINEKNIPDLITTLESWGLTGKKMGEILREPCTSAHFHVKIP